MRSVFAASLSLSIVLCLSAGYASSEGAGVIAKNPAASPTAAQIVFEADFGGPLNLWIASIDGRNVRQLTNQATTDEEPTWSSDGKTIAFASTKSSADATDIWSIQSDGSKLVQLTSSSLHNRQPTWSPDGKRLAFVSDRGGSNDIWIMNADGGAQTRVTTLAGDEDHPSFAPAGDRIVFSEIVNNVASLMIVNVDGTGLQTLTTGGARDWNPSWSKQGILFSSDRGNSGHWTIWQVQPDGSALSEVGQNIGLDPIRLPDGRIVFTDETNGFAAISAVMALDPATGAKTRVSTIDGFLVPIDIRPGGTPNPINPKSGGVVPVAILSTPTFDASTGVDPTSLTFGVTGNEASFVRCNESSEDANADTLPDLVCHFRTSATGFKSGDTLGILRARTVDGLAIEGRDSIVVVPK